MISFVILPRKASVAVIPANTRGIVKVYLCGFKLQLCAAFCVDLCNQSTGNICSRKPVALSDSSMGTRYLKVCACDEVTTGYKTRASLQLRSIFEWFVYYRFQEFLPDSGFEQCEDLPELIFTVHRLLLTID